MNLVVLLVDIPYKEFAFGCEHDNATDQKGFNCIDGRDSHKQDFYPGYILQRWCTGKSSRDENQSTNG